jgi:hypothetical protein
MAKQKSIGMVTTNILNTIIEYTLISSILDKICEMTIKPLEYPKDPTLLDRLKNLLEIKTWGISWERKIDKHYNRRGVYCDPNIIANNKEKSF